MDEPQDFATLVRRHQGAVCAVAYSVLRDRGRSEEVAQEAFLVAWQKLPGLDAPPTMPAWICGIARNLAANAARRRKETAMPEHVLADPHTPLESLLDRERDQLAERALGELPPREREVITLYYRNEHSLAEVASALGISEPAARQGLHRGRERLKSALAAVETTLRATRPSPAFAAACVAALAGGLASRASAATAETAGVKLGLWLGAAAIALFVAAGLIVTTATGSATAGSEEPGALAATSDANATSSTTLATSTALRLDPLQRSIALASMHDALATQPEPAAEASPTALEEPEREPHRLTYDFSSMAIDRSAEPPMTPPPPGPVENKAQFRYAFKTVAPLIYECVTKAGHTERRGNLRFSMHFVGDPQGGTVADAVELGPAPGDAPVVTQIDLDAAAAECVRETLMTIELPGPEQPTNFDVSFAYNVM